MSKTSHDPWRWQQGKCGTYACALLSVRPELKFGSTGYDDGEFYEPQHFFAHDGVTAYDSLGSHSMPYLGINRQFNHVEPDEVPEWYGLPDEESGPEGPEVSITAALELARELGQVK